ncbi:ABC transporter permease [Halolamina sp. CBA1230]|uniref:ABC transporter permease n=1 Tax=Halolamina sp. CBA1230 TaxID=1853690 RepID=UPI0009A1ADBF|nr:ABC transporter permease [Halolamina sp. CBA1230]QKY19310.1 ABC transporter permease [Halolamina sp. CBA1230]
MPSKEFESAAFTEVEWDARDSRFTVRKRTLGLLAAFLLLAALYAYDAIVAPEELVAVLNWDVTRADWLLLVASVFVVRYGLYPLAADPDRTRRLLRRLRSHPIGLAALLSLGVLTAIGLLGPGLFFDTGYPKLKYRLQPPVFTTVYVDDIHYYNCVGQVADGYCHGTWRYPLGTNRYGEGMLELLVYGVRIALQVSLPTVVLIGVVGTTVGAVAGYYGGLVDDILMRYVDIQQTVPAIVVYILLATFFLGDYEGVADGGLFAFVAVFGLLNWGGVARVVRSNALRQRSSGYVLAARATGASDLQILRDRIVPNARGTIVTALSRRVPLLVLAQVALAYLSLSRIASESLGRVIRVGLVSDTMPWHQKWWVTTFAVALLAFAVAAFNVSGDSLRDALDTREGGSS